MAYPQIVEYNEAVQHPGQAFTDPALRAGSTKENNLGLPVVLSGGFALTYTVESGSKKYAVRCFHREIPGIQQKYQAISQTLAKLKSPYFVDFQFTHDGIRVRQAKFPIVRMDWVEGEPLGVWLDAHYKDSSALKLIRDQFIELSAYLEAQGVAHGDIQNGNVIVSRGKLKLIDYDGMFVPGMKTGNGSELGHKHFQHSLRSADHFGPAMDRFSFIAVDLSLRAVMADSSLFPKHREGGETIIFRANDLADPDNSEIFRRLSTLPGLGTPAAHFAAICKSEIVLTPTLQDFLAGKNIPAPTTKTRGATPAKRQQPIGYISAFPVLDALQFSAGARLVGSRVELIGQITEIKHGVGSRGRGRGKPYVLINFSNWREDHINLSIWSEGLAALHEQPSNAWVGKWVSVTGLLNAPYTSRRFRYTSLSITIEQEGQIQWISAADAKFRLHKGARTGSASSDTTTPKNADVLKRHTRPKAPAEKPSSSKAGPAPTTKPSKNADILDKYRKQTTTIPSPTPSRPAPSTSPPPATSSVGVFARVPGWVWVVGGLLLLMFLGRS